MVKRFFWLTIFSLLLSPTLYGQGVEFGYTDITGKEANLRDYRGKWIVVNYWATWCPPCLEEIPELELFHQNHHAKDAVVVGMNMEEIAPEELATFVEDQMISYPIVANATPAVAIGAVPGLPTTYLINPQGVVVARQIGPVTIEMIETFMRK